MLLHLKIAGMGNLIADTPCQTCCPLAIKACFQCLHSVMNYFHDQPLLSMTGNTTCSDYKLLLRLIRNYHTINCVSYPTQLSISFIAQDPQKERINNASTFFGPYGCNCPYLEYY